MTEFTRVRPASTRRGAVSRFNDNTMEYVIAGARVLTAVAVLGTLAALVGCIWAGGWPWALTSALAILVATAAGWFGFKANGNKEWFDESTE